MLLMHAAVAETESLGGSWFRAAPWLMALEIKMLKKGRGGATGLCVAARWMLYAFDREHAPKGLPPEWSDDGRSVTVH